jgi:hypothetical protein
MSYDHSNFVIELWTSQIPDPPILRRTSFSKVRFHGMLTLVALSGCLAHYQNVSLPISTRVRDLLSRMTIHEKIGQMVQIDERTLRRSSSGSSRVPLSLCSR